MPTLPNDFANNVASSSTAFISTMSPLLTLIVGVLLGAIILEIIIQAIRHRS